MNTEAPRALPELSAGRIDEIEDALFADIARERRRRRTRRGRIWIGAGAAAAVIVVAAVIAPSVVGTIGMSAGSDAAQPAVAPDTGFATDGSGVKSEQSTGDSAGGALAPDATSTAGRDIITSASATLVVDDVPAAARAIGNAAAAHGGYVESMSVGTTAGSPTVDPQSGVAYDVVPYPSGAWVNVRVPADELDAVIAELSDVGEVTASSINRQDVTEQTIDLQARIDAAQASVDRLTELMAQATSVADLIAAESALSDRQATLESYQQQLKSLDSMVEMSSLSVNLTPKVVVVEADPAGFGDGLTAGWNGLVATLNGIVIGIGFLLPWIAVIGVIGLIVWAVVRVVRRPKTAPPRPSDASEADR